MYYGLDMQRQIALTRVRRSILKMENILDGMTLDAPGRILAVGILERLRRKQAGLLPANENPVEGNCALTAADFDEPHATRKLWRRAQVSLKLIARRMVHRT